MFAHTDSVRSDLVKKITECSETGFGMQDIGKMQASDLDVDVGAVPYEQLETERTVPRGSREVQRRETLLVHLVDVGPTFYQLVHHDILPIIAGHVQRSVPVRVRLVDLQKAQSVRTTTTMIIIIMELELVQMYCTNMETIIKQLTIITCALYALYSVL